MAGGTICCPALSLFPGKRLAAMASIVGATIVGMTSVWTAAATKAVVVATENQKIPTANAKRSAEMPILEPEFPAFLIAATAAVVIEVEVPAGAGMAAPKT